MKWETEEDLGDLEGFHIWRPQIFRIFWPLPPLSLSQISWFCFFHLLFGAPLPTPTADVIYGSPHMQFASIECSLWEGAALSITFALPFLAEWIFLWRVCQCIELFGCFSGMNKFKARTWEQKYTESAKYIWQLLLFKTTTTLNKVSNYTGFWLYGLRIYGLFGIISVIWSMVNQILGLNFSDIWSFRLYGQLYQDKTVDHISETWCIAESARQLGKMVDHPYTKKKKMTLLGP